VATVPDPLNACLSRDFTVAVFTGKQVWTELMGRQSEAIVTLISSFIENGNSAGSNKCCFI